MKRISKIITVALVICTALAGCANTEQVYTTDAVTEEIAEWPDNAYTQMIPTPEHGTLYDEKAEYFSGCQ